jgi:hypothetical protein
MERIHVAIRLALLIALGMIGCSSLYWILYIALPAIAALLISTKSAGRYLAEDGPRLSRALAWLTGAYAYLWLLTDEVPSEPHAAVEVQIETGGTPAAGSALARLLYSLPALLLLAILSIAGSLLWVIGAIAILIRRRTPSAIASFFSLTLQYQLRLAAYHLSLVDRYPSFGEARPSTLSHAA